VDEFPFAWLLTGLGRETSEMGLEGFLHEFRKAGLEAREPCPSLARLTVTEIAQSKGLCRRILCFNSSIASIAAFRFATAAA
jgi:hypothetical protein